MARKNAPSRKKSLGYYAKVKKGGGTATDEMARERENVMQNLNLVEVSLRCHPRQHVSSFRGAPHGSTECWRA